MKLFGLSFFFALVCLPGWAGEEGTDYSRNGFPFLQKHCMACHGEKIKKSGLTFVDYKDDAAVLKNRAIWKTALTLVVSGEMPPEDKPRPPANEIEAFEKSVAGIFEKSDHDAKPDSGRVAMHRMNKTEYNNTVRDLLQIDFNAAEDFPADEVGHGFDNISDVQWVSSAHLERYLAAAESVAERAIMVDILKPQWHQQNGEYLEPAGNNVPKGKFRPISGEKPDSAIFTGPLHTPFQVPADGEYIFKARLYATPDTGEPVHVAMLIKGSSLPQPAGDADLEGLYGAALKGLRPFQIMKIVEIKARSEKDAQTIEVPVPPNLGVERVALAIVQPPEGQIPKVFVEWLVLNGPLDTRLAFQRKSMTCPPDKLRGQFTRELLTRFVSRAFRRPAKPDEIERYLGMVEAAEVSGGKWEAGVREVVEAVLISPKFLFRPELESPTPKPGNQPIGEYELASRMSYFLWSSMPDDELFALAEKKELTAQLDVQVRRMLKDPKARALTDNFGMQWLQLRRLANVTPDPKTFPGFNARLKSAMLEETSLFVDAIFREDRSILDLIDADFMYLNEPLARLYGIADTNGNKSGQKPTQPVGQGFQNKGFQRVSLKDSERGGLLTQASFLTVTSNPTRTSPVKRGKWVLEQILGTPPPPPPADVPSLEKNEELKGNFPAEAGTASRKSELCGLSCAHGSDRLCIREFRCHRGVPNEGRRFADRCFRDAPGRIGLQGRGGIEDDFEEEKGFVQPLSDRKDDDLCARTRRRGV